MKYRRLLALALIVVSSVVLATLANNYGGNTGVEALENRFLDRWQQTTAESFSAAGSKRESPITLVLFDEVSVTDSIDGWPYMSPFPRRYLADLVDAIALAGARTIGIDVFLDRPYPELNAWDGGDDLLRDAMERAGNVVLVAPVMQTDSGPVLQKPHPFFSSVAADIGAAEFPSAFETFRDGALAVRSGSRLEPSFSLAMYAHARGLDVDSLLDQTLGLGRMRLEGMPDNVGVVPERLFAAPEAVQPGEAVEGSAGSLLAFRLRYVGPPSSSVSTDLPGTFQAIASAEAALIAMLQPEFFEDKIVILGSGFHDSEKFRTPFFGQRPASDSLDTFGADEAYSWMFGVELHANALQNMLDSDYVRPLSDGYELLMLFAVALVASGAAFWGGIGGGGVTVAALLGVVVYAMWAWSGGAYVAPGLQVADFSQRFLWVPIIPPIVGGVLSYFGTVGYVAVVEGREKRFIKSAFGMYVSPEVVADIADSPELLQLGGQKRPLSVLFSDLAGFTTLSERLDPQELIAMLNEYLTEMTAVVMDERGTLDKYIGDAIMAFWNAPKDLPDHADRALRTMVLSQRKMDELNHRWRAEDPDHEDLVVRIGVNTGEAVVGNVGGENRFDYSAIGDAVNLAARLEPANKSYDTLNMCSEFTLAAVSEGAFRVRELDLIAVKGKGKPVLVYEVLELAGVELSGAKEGALVAYEDGMTAYKKHDWAGARDRFAAALEACPSDGPSQVYVARCEAHLVEPPPPGWDFVVRRTEK